MKEVIEKRERDRETAQHLAERYRYEFVDLKGVHLDLDLFHSIQVDLMFRYNFVPLRTEGHALVVAMADPSDLVVIDEVSALLGRALAIKVAPLSDIQDLLKKSESSQRMLDEATEGFKLDLIREDETGRLFILEMHPAGGTWHLSTPHGLKHQRDHGLDYYGQFNALGTIAKALIDTTRTMAK